MAGEGGGLGIVGDVVESEACAYPDGVIGSGASLAMLRVVEIVKLSQLTLDAVAWR